MSTEQEKTFQAKEEEVIDTPRVVYYPENEGKFFTFIMLDGTKFQIPLNIAKTFDLVKNLAGGCADGEGIDSINIETDSFDNETMALVASFCQMMDQNRDDFENVTRNEHNRPYVKYFTSKIVKDWFDTNGFKSEYPSPPRNPKNPEVYIVTKEELDKLRPPTKEEIEVGKKLITLYRLGEYLQFDYFMRCTDKKISENMTFWKEGPLRDASGIPDDWESEQLKQEKAAGSGWMGDDYRVRD